MSVLRPEKMAKVGLLGLKEDEARILTVLHDLRVAQIEPLTPAAAALLEPERGTDAQRTVADEALRFRGLASALPPVPGAAPQRFENLDAVLAAAKTVPIDAEVGDLKREDDRLETELKGIDDDLTILEKVSFYPDRLEYLRGKSLLSFVGEADPESLAEFRAALPGSADPQILTGPAGDSVPFLVILRTSGAEALSRAAQSKGVRLTALPPFTGRATDERESRLARRTTILARRDAILARLTEIARQWYPLVAAIDEALTIESRTYEVFTKIGASRETFALEAWVPARDVNLLQTAVGRAVVGRVHFYVVPTTEEPPTMMANPKGVRRFEFFIRFYSLPQATEWDPTLVFAIVFPIFFGFMLGDWGYGLVILLISLWMIAGFPGARHLPKSGRNFVKLIMGPKGMQQLAWALLPGCGLAIGLGLYWDEFFGYHLFGAWFHYSAAIDPVRNIGLLLLFAGYVGLAMVTLGFLFGVLKEYFHHHRRGALAKSGGILFAWGVAFFGLAVIHHQTSFTADPQFGVFIGLMVVGLLLLLFGEGIQTGMMSLIEVVSHILSYTRLVGILLASVILALVINTIGGGLVVGGTIVGIIAGLVILVVGQSFNVILGVFEPGIQGARLIFVEYFSKFYSGNGKPFHPFGAARKHTVSSVGPDGSPTFPVIQGPGNGS